MDTTIKKIDSSQAPTGRLGALQLASGKAVALRLWREGPGDKEESSRPYETVGYVLRGSAELRSEGQTVRLEAGDSWLVPAEARHSYKVESEFEALEATSPPAHVRGRDGG